MRQMSRGVAYLETTWPPQLSFIHIRLLTSLVKTQERGAILENFV